MIVWNFFDIENDSIVDANIKARIYDSDGKELSPEILVNNVTSQWQVGSDVTVLADGSFIVTWESYDGTQGDDSGSAIQARIFSSDGQPTGSEFRINSFTNGLQDSANVTALANGGFVVTWRSEDQQQSDTDSFAIKARVFDASGNEVVSEFVVNEATNGAQISPEIVSLSGGGFVIAWSSNDGQQGDADDSVNARIFNDDGTEVGSEFRVNTETLAGQLLSDVAPLSNGGFIIVWRTLDGQQDGDGASIKARIFDSSGQELVSEFLVNQITAGDQTQASVTQLANGDIVVTWRSALSYDDDVILARIFDVDGTPKSDDFEIAEHPAGTQFSPIINALADGGFIVSWASLNDASNDEQSYDAKARLFDADGTPRNVGAPNEDEISRIKEGYLLANDTDVEGDDLSITDVDATSANGATVTLNQDGSVNYDPTNAADIQALGEGETLTDTFSYTVSDGNGGTDTATVSLEVDGVNDAPVAGDALTNQTADEGSAFAYSLPVDAFSDVDGDELTLAATLDDDTELPNWLMFDPDTGAFSGTPGQDDVGELTVKVTATDPSGDTAVQTFTLTIGTTNNAPVVSAIDAGAVAENAEAQTIDLLAGQTDPENDTLSAVNITVVDENDAPVQFTDNGNGAITIDPAQFADALNDGDTRNVTVSYDVSDGTDTTPNTATLDVTGLTPVPHNARINEFHYDNAGADEGEFIEIRVDAGADASALVVELYNGSNGTVYGTLNLSDLTATTDGTYDYYVLSPTSIQNGAPDGIALSDGDGLIEFISYEGTFQGVGGAADGVTSTDVGVAQSGSDPIGSSLQLQEDGSWALTEGTNTQGAVNAAPPVPHNARINEFHYDNAGADEGEFIEIRVDAGADASALVVELYNGSNGTVYGTLNLSDLTATTDGTYDYYVLSPTSIQNGAPDGIALSDGDGLIEFISYEGTLQGVGGAADGVTSTDVGVAQTGSDPIGSSLQLQEDGSWALTEGTNTQGAVNAAPPVPHNARINEFHYDNAGGDEGEFIEIRVDAGADASALVVELYNGSNGTVYGTLNLSDLTATTDGTYDYYVLSPTSIQNGAPDGIALSDGDGLIEFISYEGTFQGVGGAADGVTSTDVGVAQSGSDPIRQLPPTAGGRLLGPHRGNQHSRRCECGASGSAQRPDQRVPL